MFSIGSSYQLSRAQPTSHGLCGVKHQFFLCCRATFMASVFWVPRLRVTCTRGRHRRSHLHRKWPSSRARLRAATSCWPSSPSSRSSMPSYSPSCTLSVSALDQQVSSAHQSKCVFVVLVVCFTFLYGQRQLDMYQADGFQKSARKW